MLLFKVYWPWKGNVKGALRFLITVPNPTGFPFLRFFKLPWSLLHFFNYPYLFSWNEEELFVVTTRTKLDETIRMFFFQTTPPFFAKDFKIFQNFARFYRSCFTFLLLLLLLLFISRDFSLLLLFKFHE